MSVSLGLALLHIEADDADTFLARMDKAMYLAKRRGRNSVVMAPHPEDDR